MGLVVLDILSYINLGQTPLIPATGSIKPALLARELNMQSVRGKFWRSQFLLSLGLTENDTASRQGLLGHLDELKASNLLKGPFKINLTNHPAEHLTFDSSHRQAVNILDIESIFKLYPAQRTGVIR
jgi:hypothetical protein